MTRGWRWIVLAALLLAAGAAPAQGDARTALEEARRTVVEARDAYEIRTPDRPLWAEALRLGRAALEAEPGNPEAQLFLARTYSEVRWHIRAWQHWQAYLAGGGTLSDAGRTGPDIAAPNAPSSRELFAEAGTELGYARYQADDPEAALGYYEAVVERLPDHEEALRWVGRIHFEAGRAGEALPYWERLAELRPDDETVAYYLERTRERLAVGVEAADAFERGIGLYEAGDIAGALEAFEAALEANPEFTDAAVWAGRSALDTGRSERAVRHWETATRLAPDDARARYFLEVARTQAAHGPAATDAYYTGQAHYAEGELEEANASFVLAVEAAPEFTNAWVWAARTHQELGNFAEAIFYWQGVLRLDPDDERAEYFLTQAQNQLAHGVTAGEAFTRGVRAYQLADVAAAEAAFREAVDANQEFAAAWGWLGRIAFADGRYAEAADAFGRAAALQPENGDYAFFAAESARLAGDGDDDDADTDPGGDDPDPGDGAGDEQ